MGTLESRCSLGKSQTAFTLHCMVLLKKCSRSQKSASLKSNLPSKLRPIFWTRCQTLENRTTIFVMGFKGHSSQSLGVPFLLECLNRVQRSLDIHYIQKSRNPEIQNSKFKSTEIQNAKKSRIQTFAKNTEIHKSKNPKIQKYSFTEIQKSRHPEIQNFRNLEI